MKASFLVRCLIGLAGLTTLAGCGGGVPLPATGTSGASGGGTTGSAGATGPNSALNGKYAFSFTGAATQTGHPLFMAGSFTADGSGNITAGEEDVNEVAIGASKGIALTGSYTIGTDGRGTLNFTGAVNQTFKIVVESGNHGQLVRFDTGASGSGTFDLQTASAFSLRSLQGRFVFDWNGVNQSEDPLSAIGALTLSGTGAASGAADLNQAGSYGQATVTGAFQAPDGNGRGTATISYGSSTIPMPMTLFRRVGFY